MEEVKKKGSSVDGHKLVMTLIFIAVTAVIFLAIGYVAGKNEVDNQQTALVEDTATTTTTALKSTTATTSATADETADWKTYTNDEYGFSFKYPSSRWTLTEGTTQAFPQAIVSVKSNTANPDKIWPGRDGEHYYDQVIVNKENENSASEWIQARLAGGYSDNSRIVTINGSEYTEIVPGSDPDYLAELKLNNGILFSIVFDWAKGRSDITTTQEQILSTFQFTK